MSDVSASAPQPLADVSASAPQPLADQFAACSAEVEGLDLGSARVRSPVAPVLSFSLGTAFAVLAAHERRHLAQARRVVDAPGFPMG